MEVCFGFVAISFIITYFLINRMVKEDNATQQTPDDADELSTEDKMMRLYILRQLSNQMNPNNFDGNPHNDSFGSIITPGTDANRGFRQNPPWNHH